MRRRPPAHETGQLALLGQPLALGSPTFRFGTRHLLFALAGFLRGRRHLFFLAVVEQRRATRQQFVQLGELGVPFVPFCGRRRAT
jgi:hypothetical protein